MLALLVLCLVFESARADASLPAMNNSEYVIKLRKLQEQCPSVPLICPSTEEQIRKLEKAEKAGEVKQKHIEKDAQDTAKASEVATKALAAIRKQLEHEKRERREQTQQAAEKAAREEKQLKVHEEKVQKKSAKQAQALRQAHTDLEHLTARAEQATAHEKRGKTTLRQQLDHARSELLKVSKAKREQRKVWKKLRLQFSRTRQELVRSRSKVQEASRLKSAHHQQQQVAEQANEKYRVAQQVLKEVAQKLHTTQTNYHKQSNDSRTTRESLKEVMNKLRLSQRKNRLVINAGNREAVVRSVNRDKVTVKTSNRKWALFEPSRVSRDKQGYVVTSEGWSGPYSIGLVTENKRHLNEAWEQTYRHLASSLEFWPGLGRVRISKKRQPNWEAPPPQYRWEAERRLQSAVNRFNVNPTSRMLGAEKNRENPWRYPLTQKGEMCSPACSLTIGYTFAGGKWTPDLNNRDAPGGGFANPGEKFGCYKACVVEGGGFSLRLNGKQAWAALKRAGRGKLGHSKQPCHHCWRGNHWGQIRFEVRVLATKEMRCLNSNWREPSQFAAYGMWYWYDAAGPTGKKWHKDSPQQIYAAAIREILKKDPTAKVSYGDIEACKWSHFGIHRASGEWSQFGGNNKWRHCWGGYQRHTRQCQSKPAVEPLSLIKDDCAQGGPPVIRNHPNKAAAGLAYLRLCHPCTTKCEVQKTCHIRAARISHIEQHDVRDLNVDLSTVAKGLAKVGGSVLCTNF